MIYKIRDPLEGSYRLVKALSRPSFVMGAGRHFIETVLRNSDSDLYDKYKPNNSEKENILFLPGWASDGGSFERLAKPLRRTANLYTPDNFPRDIYAVFSKMSMAEQAISLLEYIDKIREVDGIRKKIHLVCHSNGGLISLMALKFLHDVGENRGKIGKIITMASPLRPSKKFKCGHIPLSGRLWGAVKDIRPDSSLYELVWPHYHKISFSMVAMKDELIPPLMQFADLEKVMGFDFGHYGFFDKKNVLRVANIIQGEIDD